MASIASSLERIKDNPLGILDRQTDRAGLPRMQLHWRDRELDPATTVALFMQQVVHGNAPVQRSAGMSRRQRRLVHRPGLLRCAGAAAAGGLPDACSRRCISGSLPHTAPRGTSVARPSHLPHRRLDLLHARHAGAAQGLRHARRGRSRAAAFRWPICWCCSAPPPGMLIDAWASPLSTGDLAETPEAHLHLDEGDILIGDDTFSGYPHLALLKKQGLHGLFPVHHLRIVDFKKGRPHCGEGKKAVAGMPRSRWIKSLGKEDQLVEYFKPTQNSRRG